MFRSRNTAVLIIIVAAIAALAVAAPRDFARSLTHGAAWGLGREAAHHAFRSLIRP
jgi:hypothetical protein